jgi:VIT1/CCC1 family predicted Fe2+/Mn2+ transporter
VPAKAKFFVFAVVFAFGAIMAVTPYFTLDNFWLLIPGVILVAVSAPFMYYFYAKTKYERKRMTEEEVLRQAQFEARIPKESDDAKK